MINKTMPAIRLRWRSGQTIVLPEWRAVLPEVRTEERVHLAFVDYFMAQRMDRARAERCARSIIQQTFQRAYVDGLRRAVARRAIEFAESWPGAVRPADRPGEVTLDGFSPAKVASMYVPFQNTGRAGLRFARKMLADMAEEGREE